MIFSDPNLYGKIDFLRYSWLLNLLTHSKAIQNGILQGVFVIELLEIGYSQKSAFNTCILLNIDET